MIPALAITYRDGRSSVFQPTTLAMWWLDDVFGNVREASEYALRLAMAYYEAHGEPEDAVPLPDIRSWAKAEGVTVEVADSAAGPTRPDPSGAPSSSSPSSPAPR